MIARSTSAPLLYEVAEEIRNISRIWLIQKINEGLLFRAKAGRKQFRIFIPRLKIDSTEPVEKGSPVHCATDLLQLRQ